MPPVVEGTTPPPTPSSDNRIIVENYTSYKVTVTPVTGTPWDVQLVGPADSVFYPDSLVVGGNGQRLVKIPVIKTFTGEDPAPNYEKLIYPHGASNIQVIGTSGEMVAADTAQINCGFGNFGFGFWPNNYPTAAPGSTGATIKVYINALPVWGFDLPITVTGSVGGHTLTFSPSTLNFTEEWLVLADNGDMPDTISHYPFAVTNLPSLATGSHPLTVTCTATNPLTSETYSHTTEIYYVVSEAYAGEDWTGKDEGAAQPFEMAHVITGFSELPQYRCLQNIVKALVFPDVDQYPAESEGDVTFLNDGDFLIENHCTVNYVPDPGGSCGDTTPPFKDVFIGNEGTEWPFFLGVTAPISGFDWGYTGIGDVRNFPYAMQVSCTLNGINVTKWFLISDLLLE